MNRILIIEDDSAIAGLLQIYLIKNGDYDVTVTRSAEAALPLLREREYACILLDIMLPGVDGITFCHQIRSSIYCPIIFISCLDNDETIIRAMNMGGDDYLIKPFTSSLLLAYVDANIRRSQMVHQDVSLLTVGDLRLDPRMHMVSKNGSEIVLSPTEYEILYFMMHHRDEYLSFKDIYVAVWGESHYITIRTLFTHVLNLRKKIEDDVKKPRYIKTYRRSGYIFSE
jgi:DNA-binding response OmpR family regulator